ncbi:tRNA dimethylallyltransferase [Melghiribacillus thermohalophilus]|uniref:tRNA dimethylallyltransferase n=1 Tax=Melghiribacillus thermohalophilus TaxID=1324956 RepID=A0A4R3NDJ3_9BACI|nr:tRNA (adenosine(37)-N6)-dimethylallyltransferase MiaA [Melghiribacillus thermohalophilus]TCT26685.1 tRNA dimethylallyltransferase [Melghiribacillus thermohalophilus]
MKIPVVAVVGPTAVGKTKLSVELAKRFSGEVISGDSMQIYRGMDIGTAKITENEKQGIPHYMIDIKDPDESFSVYEFQQMVQRHIQQIHKRGNLPIIAGGTGFYIHAALYDFQFTDLRRNEQFEQELKEQIEKRGMEPYYERLKEIDPEHAEKIHPNNIRRVIRALEIYETTGKTMTEIQREQTSDSPYHPILIGLEMDRNELYERINRRVDQMMEQGLLDEVTRLYEKGLKDTQAMQGIGYKEFIPYFEGDISLEEAVEMLKRNSRRYAKRQYTYFKNKLDVRWYSVSEKTAEENFSIIFDELEGMLKKITK